MAQADMHEGLTPLQRAIYDVDQLGLNLRDSMRLVTQRMGFFVGQQRYLQERERIRAIMGRQNSEVGNQTAGPSDF
jgi:hypothetical protein